MGMDIYLPRCASTIGCSNRILGHHGRGVAAGAAGSADGGVSDGGGVPDAAV